MNLSAKTEYACVAVLELAKRFGSPEPLQAKSIAERHHIPSRFLVQILHQLKGAGLVTSTRGAAGGYQLAHDPHQITLADVRTIVEGPREQLTPTENATWATRTIRKAWCTAASCEEDSLAAITFADLVTRSASNEGMYYI